jgi:1,4-dihydroxy-2-naphthoate octaprenyltransferase
MLRRPAFAAAAIKPMQEPTLTSLTTPPARYLAATRPGFLAASAVPVLIGVAVAFLEGEFHGLLALLTLFGALLAHGGANVLNDYYDERAGCDGINDDRVFPFTGGSRVLQNSVLTLDQMARFGWVLMATAASIGLALTMLSGPLLLGIGLVGLIIGWAYSAPPLRLCARGLGELSVALAFGVLIPVGAAYVQLGEISPAAIWAGLPIALFISLVLYINQFPDLRADAATGKRNLVVRLGSDKARAGYPVMVALAYGILILGATIGVLPGFALLGLLSAPLHGRAGAILWRHAGEPDALRPAIVATLSGAMAHGLLLTVGLTLAALLSPTP